MRSGVSGLGWLLLCGCAGIVALAQPAAARPEPPDPEQQLAAQRRQNQAANQRTILAAFHTLQQPTPGAPPVLTAQLGHSRAINSLVLSADGRLALTGSDDRTARLWALDSGRELRRFLGQQSNVTVAALSPDGQLVATGGGDDPTVRVWETRTGAQRLALNGHREAVSALQFLPDGQKLVSIGWDDTLRVWELATGKESRKFEKSVRGLAAAFAPDGKTVMTVDAADHVTLLDVATGTVRKQLEITESMPAFGFAADATLTAIGGRECDAQGSSCRAKVWLWDEVRSAVQPLPSGGDYLIRALAVSPDKQRLAVGTGVGVLGTCDDRCAVLLLELPSGRELWHKANLGGDVKALAFAADGKSLLSAGNDGLVRVFATATGHTLATLGGDVAPVAAVALSPDGKWLAVGTGNGVDLSQAQRDQHVFLWELASGREARRLTLAGSAVATLVFSADSRLLAASSRGDPENCPRCTARLWEVASGREIQNFPTDVRRGGLALSPDGRTVAGSTASTDDYGMGLWEAATGKLLQRVDSGELWAFAFAPGGTVLATVGGAGDVTLRSAKTGQETRHLSDAHADLRPCVAFAPDGKLVAAGATSLYSSAVWDLASGRVVSRLDGHSRDVTAIALSGRRAPRGGLVATASLDSTALLWAARKAQLQQVLVGHLGGVTAVAFSANDKFVLTGSMDGTARLWDTKTGRQRLQLVSFRDGDWLVLGADGRFDTSSPDRGYHWVQGDQVLPLIQSQTLARSVHEPGLLRRVLSGKSAPPLRAKTDAGPAAPDGNSSPPR